MPKKKHIKPVKEKGSIECRVCVGYGYFPNPGTMVGSGIKKRENCDVCLGKGSYPKLTEADKKAFKDACVSTFNYISADLPEDAENMPLSHVVEITLDADYMDRYGHRGFSPSSKQTVVRLRQIRHSKFANRLAREAFSR